MRSELRRTAAIGLTLAWLAAMAGMPAFAADAKPKASRPAPATSAHPAESGRPTDDDDSEESAAADDANQGADGTLQRADKENPQNRRRFATDPSAGGGGTTKPGGRPTTFESVSSSRAAASRVQTEPATGPKPVASPSQVEQLVQRSNTAIDFFEMVDDILDEIARQISREDPALLSPMAIRLVRLSSNIRPEFARTLEARLIARLVTASSVKVTVCAECTALRSRVENGSWTVTLGAVKQDDLRRLGESTGIKTFLDVDFSYSPQSNVIWLEAIAFRASDGGVVWSDGYRSDATMAALLRTGKRIPSRAERAAELEAKIAARPNYGYSASLGIAQIGYAAPTGSIVGAQIGLRFHERFGEQNTSLFGMAAGIITTGVPKEGKVPQALNTILLGGYYSYNVTQPNLNRPELWLYGEAGGMFSGNEGNTFYLESGADVHLKWRLSLQGGLQYILPTKFSGYDLGGLGFRLRTALNW
jgi:hypothetical protein